MPKNLVSTGQAEFQRGDGTFASPNSVPVLTITYPTGAQNQYVWTSDAQGNGSWAAAAGGAPTGTAGGDLGSTYPNPTVVATHLASALPVNQGGTGSTSQNFAGLMTPAGVKTSAYNAVAGDYIPVDTTSGSVTITLPTAPADLTVIGIKMITQGSTNTVTYACGGSDVFNKTGGATSGTLTLASQGVILQYKASGAIWYVFSDDLPLSQLDLRYLKLSGGTMSGAIAMGSNKITGLTNGSGAQDGAAFGQIPTSASSIGGLLASNNLSDVGTAATALSNLGGLPLAGGTMSGAIAMGSHKVTGLTNGSSAQDAAAYGQTVGGGGLAPMTTEGDIIIANATPSPARLAVGSSSPAVQVLGVSSGMPAWVNQVYGGLFGDGSDGSATLDGTVTPSWISHTGSVGSYVYTLTRDVFLTSLTINNGITLKAAGYIIFCAGTVTNNGTIGVAGNNASGATHGTATTAGTVGPGEAGGSGTSGNGAQGAAPVMSFGNGYGGASGAGQSGTAASQLNPTIATAWPFRKPFTVLGGGLQAVINNAVSAPAGGIGGGSGGGDGANSGGGGGGGGPLIVIAAWSVVNNGTITCPGGNGGTPPTGNCGGGGGGGGGSIIVYTLSAWTAGTTNVAGGTAGSAVGTGGAGSNGGSGTVLNVIVQ